jgi:hypothetical protein
MRGVFVGMLLLVMLLRGEAPFSAPSVLTGRLCLMALPARIHNCCTVHTKLRIATNEGEVEYDVEPVEMAGRSFCGLPSLSLLHLCQAHFPTVLSKTFSG